MNSPAKIRILLVDDPLPSLFMAAWYRQNELHFDRSLYTIAIYDGLHLNETHFKDFNLQQKKHIDSTRAPLDSIIQKWLVLPSKRYGPLTPSLFRIRAVGLERKTRKRELQEIQDLLEREHIDRFAVSEIWSRDAFIDRHLLYLCPHARAYFFDHGLSDIRNALLASQEVKGRLDILPQPLRRPLKILKRKILNFFHYHFYFFSELKFDRVKRVSLLAPEINSANGDQQVADIHPHFILEASKVSTEIYSHSPRPEIGRTALILLMYVYHKPWGVNFKNDQTRMLRDFEKLLIENCDTLFKELGIETLVFKGRLFHEDHTAETVRSFENLAKKYKIVYLSDFSPRNYPTEFYLESLNPKAIVSAFSSAGFFAKKINPNIVSITYDTWFVRYIDENFGSKFADFEWYRPLFQHKLGSFFKNLLPLSIPKRSDLNSNKIESE